MHKLIALVLILNFYNSTICMNQLVRKFNPGQASKLVRSFSSSKSRKELAYDFFKLHQFTRKYSQEQLEKIYSYYIKLYYPVEKTEVNNTTKNKLTEIDESFYMIQLHQRFVTQNKIYESYTLSDSELENILDAIKKDHQEWQTNLEIEQKKEEEKQRRSKNVRNIFKATAGMMFLGASKFIFEQASDKLDKVS